MVGLLLGDDPGRWSALGFAVADGAVTLGGVRIALGAPSQGISRWTLHGIETTTHDIDGLPTSSIPTVPQPDPVTHPNGATGIDHIVITSPDFDRTAQALQTAGMPLRRTRDAGGFRQGFRRLGGSAILELVEAKQTEHGPARFWGLTLIVEDLGQLKQRLGPHLGDPKPAVQPGRHIATLRRTAGLGQPLAFMDPEPRTAPEPS